MKSVVSTFIIIIGFTMMTLIGGSLILAQTEISAAKEMHTNCLIRLQASAYNEDVFNECATEVAGIGEGWSLEQPKQVTVFKDRKAKKITMNYRLSIPYFGLVKDCSITGYGK